MDISLSLAVKRKLDNSDNTNLCDDDKKAKKAKKVRKEEEFSLQSGQMIVSKKIPTSSSVELGTNIASISCDQIDEKIKKKAKKKNKSNIKENVCLYVSDERESRPYFQDLDAMKDRDKKKKKSKKQKRNELVDSGDLASQVQRDEKVGLLSGQMIFSGKISTTNDEEQSPKEKKKKKKSKRTVQEDDEKCKNTHTMPRDQADEIPTAIDEEQSPKKIKKEKKSKRTVQEDDAKCRYIHTSPSGQVDEIPTANDEDQSPKKKKKKKKSKRTVQEDEENDKIISMMSSNRADEKMMKKEKKKRKIDNEEDRSLYVSDKRDSWSSCQHLDVMGSKDKKRKKLKKQKRKELIDSGDLAVQASGLVIDHEDMTVHEHGRSEDSVISAAPVSCHVPVTPMGKSHLTNIAKEAVSEVLSNSVGSLEESRPHGSKLSQRRSLVNYELLCKTDSSRDRKVYIDDDSKTVGKYTENNNNESSKITSSPIVKDIRDEAVSDTLAKKVVTIKDLYKLPKRKKVPPVVYDACKFIFSQQIPVSDVNRAYTGHCVPGDMNYRKLLKKKYRAKFGKYYEEQDEMLLKRFNILVQNGVVENREQFCNFLNTYCSGKDKKELAKNTRNIGVRNIIGLFIGQDMPRKLAAVHCLRLIKLVLGHSYLFKRQEEVKKSDLDTIGSPLVEQADDDLAIPDNDDKDADRSHNANQVRKRITKKWTYDEDKFLIKWVIGGSGPKVDDVDPMKVDWEGASKSLERDIQNVREHWCRTIQPVLVEDVEPVAILLFRKELLEEVVKSKAGNRKDINWASLAKLFRPRSTYAISATFHDLMRGSRVCSSKETSEEFRERVNLVLSKVIRNLALPEEKMAKCVRKTTYKKELQEYYWNLLD